MGVERRSEASSERLFWILVQALFNRSPLWGLHPIKQALLQTGRPSGAKAGSVGAKLFVVTGYPQKESSVGATYWRNPNSLLKVLIQQCLDRSATLARRTGPILVSTQF